MTEALSENGSAEPLGRQAMEAFEPDRDEIDAKLYKNIVDKEWLR